MKPTEQTVESAIRELSRSRFLPAPDLRAEFQSRFGALSKAEKETLRN